MVYQKVKGYVKGAVAHVGGKIKKRYAPKGKINYGRIATDTAKLVQLMNVEKKYVDTVIVTNDAQFSQTNPYTVICTPVIGQGITGQTRNGNSVKLVSARLDMQIKGDVLCANEFKYKWYLVSKPDNTVPQGAFTASGQMFDNNIFGSSFDYHSQRDPEHFSSFKVVASGAGQLKADSITGQTGINQFSKNLKLNHHLKYDTNGSAVTTKNEFYLFVVSDSGNSGATTGGLVTWSLRTWFVDN